MADHRQRLLEGMTQAAARHGYGGASVARAIERAGVSRATFYKHFRDRQECLLAAYLDAVERARAGLAEAADGACSADRPGAVLGEILGRVAADPATARLVLVEAPAADSSVRAEYERTIEQAEAAIECFLGDLAASGLTLQIPSTALLGAIAGIASTRVFAGEAEALPASLGDLLAWLDSYALPATAARWSDAQWAAPGRELPADSPLPARGAIAPLPRGRSALSPAEAGPVRRRRILDAIARLVAERGYAAVTVADIVAAAHTSRRAFYSHFKGKEDAFLAIQTVALQESIGAAAGEFFAGEGWPDRVWRAGHAMFSYGARNPQLAYLWIAESHAAGPRAIRRQHEARTAYTVFLEEGYALADRAQPLPRLASDAIAWAVFALMRGQVVRGRATEMLEVLPQAAYVILAPFIGPSAAMEFVEARTRSAGREAPAARRPSRARPARAGTEPPAAPA